MMTIPMPIEHGLGRSVKILTLDPKTIHQVDDGRWFVWAHQLGNVNQGVHISASSREALENKIARSRAANAH